MTQVHPNAVVGAGVELGERVVVGPNAVLFGPCRIGDDCWIGPGCVIGTPPELTTAQHDAGWEARSEWAGVEIGPRTVVRELSTIHQGSYRSTRVGSDCWLLNRCYVAHDCLVDDRVTLSAGVSLGGHVRVGDRVNVGMNAVVHQRRVVGPGSMVGMGSAVTRDVPPFAKVYGSPARLRGVNVAGMARVGIAEDVVRLLSAAYAEPVLPDAVPSVLTRAFAWWSAAEPSRPLVSATATAE
ncbi:acyl-[acyl-carrier-protein]--UDP-N-acetylglucosamine O-acyltransferase [Longimycelium tulufanense]|uniref:Acyl-[acyl-carrier-protein]--UDP-N-acetylglucosamine O-acyltransferase n=1 Tax=Longimycelium tulufanense TaxID=907463 RepID=A0A8J3FTB3_9PSEU|nr:DapH/DapD/GlmU-related protein [Longimycelium tulufanense]GGM47939.1 acyl-[acyl-carrier-protein]--UDP-N-acetylglucosamine O-acyltransferase [Longimycelium tulufanense]